MNTSRISVVTPVVFLAALIAVWETAVRLTGVRPQILPAPSRVVTAGWEPVSYTHLTLPTKA
mgnify:CR=1 FL=1